MPKTQHYPNAGCNGIQNGAVTQTASRVMNPIKKDVFIWKSPNNYTGLVTFYAVGIISDKEWYGQTKRIANVVRIVKPTSKKSY